MAEDSDDERSHFTAIEVDADETQAFEVNLIQGMAGAFAMWGVGFEVMRAYVEEWTSRRQTNLREGMSKLFEAVQLETPELRANAVSDLFIEQIETSIKDFAAAGYKAMTYAGAYGKKLTENADKGASTGRGIPGMDFGMGTRPTPPPSPAASGGQRDQPTPGRRGQRRDRDA